MAEEPDPGDEWVRDARGYSAGDDRHFQLYLCVLQRWGTAQELERVVRKLGDAERISEKLVEVEAVLKLLGADEREALEGRMEQWKWNRRFWGSVGWVLRMAGAAGAVFGALLGAKGVWTWLAGG